MTVEDNLSKLADPNRGRLVAVALSPNGRNFRLFTGMGGRSEASKNRYYQVLEDLNGNGEFLKTAIYDYTKPGGDVLATLYVAQRSWGPWHVASNGEQTDGIGVALASGAHFERAQRQYQHEGPKNGNTPRITAAVNKDESYIWIGQILPDQDNLALSQYRGHRFHIVPGYGLFTATYDGKSGTDANYDNPWIFPVHKTLEEDMDEIWNTWDPNTKGNLSGKEIERGSGRFFYSLRSIHPILTPTIG